MGRNRRSRADRGASLIGMEARTGSFTVAAVLGTGLATLGFALSGVSALGDDLHAAALTPAATTPVLSPSEERRDALTAPEPGKPDAPGTTPAADALTLQQACDRKHGSGQHHGGSARSAPATAGAGTVAKEY